jgi:hypothetical protein
LGEKAFPHREKSKLTAKKKRQMPKTAVKLLPTLADVERDVVLEYRELGRQELARRLQQLADQNGELFPPAATQTPPADAAH